MFDYFIGLLGEFGICCVSGDCDRMTDWRRVRGMIWSRDGGGLWGKNELKTKPKTNPSVRVKSRFFGGI